jgi:hypothetical protein
VGRNLLMHFTISDVALAAVAVVLVIALFHGFG